MFMINHKLLLIFLIILQFHLFGLAPVAVGQQIAEINPKNAYESLANISYANDQRNTFDLFRPKANGQAIPLVIFFHGGSFKKGDKRQIKRQYEIITNLLNHNIAFASVNYRFSIDNDSLGVQRCLNDAVTFIQFIRYHANEFGIDKTQIGCYGESAGAGISLFLACHDDFALAESAIPEKRESSRVKCAGAIATQATYDLLRWKSYIPGLGLLYPLFRHKLKDPLANFYGYPDYKAFKPNRKEVSEKLDMLKMISPDDPPLWLCHRIHWGVWIALD